MWRTCNTALGLPCIFFSHSHDIIIITNNPPSTCFHVYWAPFTVTPANWVVPLALACFLPEEFLEVLPAARRPWEHTIVSGQRGRHDAAFRLPAGVAFSIMNHAKTRTESKQKGFRDPFSKLWAEDEKGVLRIREPKWGTELLKLQEEKRAGP